MPDGFLEDLGMRIANGRVITTDPYNPDTDGTEEVTEKVPRRLLMCSMVL